MSTVFCTDPSMHLLNCMERSTIRLLSDLEQDSSRDSLLRIRGKVFTSFKHLNTSYKTTHGIVTPDIKRKNTLLDKHNLELARLISINNMLNQKFSELQTSLPTPSLCQRFRNKLGQLSYSLFSCKKRPLHSGTGTVLEMQRF